MLSSASKPRALRPLALRVPALSVHATGLILIPLAILALAAVQPVDFDYWWQRRTGQWIVENFAVPRTEFYSFTAAGHAYTDHEWLSQVLMYGVDSAFGYLALFVLFVGLGIAAWFIGYRLLRAHGIGETPAIALSIAPAIIGMKFWRVRPFMFTVFFASLFLSELFAARRGERKTLWRLVPLMVLWANLHGGYVIGLVLIALLAGSQWWDRKAGVGPGWRHVSIVLLVSFAATAINPNTYEVWTYPLSYLRNNNPNLQLVDEWQAPNFHQMRNLPLAILLITAMVFGANGRRFDAWRSSLLVVFGAMALQSMRHQPLFAAVWAPCVGIAMAERWAIMRERPSDAPRSPGVPLLNWALLCAGAIALGSVVMAAPGHPTLGAAPTDAARNPQPAAATDYVEAHYPGARIFNEYIWGGYLIDRLYPQNKIFIDGRADPYGGLLSTYENAIYARDWQSPFEQYDVDVALIPPNMPLAGALRYAGWTEAYEDKVAVLFVRPGYAAAE